MAFRFLRWHPPSASIRNQCDALGKPMSTKVATTRLALRVRFSESPDLCDKVGNHEPAFRLGHDLAQGYP
jgi:hypothetical protein